MKELKSKRIVIAGGTGFLGKSLARYFEEQGFEVVTLSRKRNPQSTPATTKTMYWNGRDLGNWTLQLEGCHALINLAGKSVDCRYTPANKKAIVDSRVLSTRILNKAIASLQEPPRYFLNSSTATIYIHSETQLNTETNGIIGDDFSMNVARSWEREFFSTESHGTQKIALRTSIVLGNGGGALPIMKNLARLGMGGKAGRGTQMMSWIHIQDFCRAVGFLLQSRLTGPVNVTAPTSVSNVNFMKALRQSLMVSIGISQPRWLLELGSLLIGTETELLLKSRNVFPERLLNHGFSFEYSEIKPALENLL
ncbi:MAG: TIGR01777 family oxidoreductase [Nonlabens sp.]